MHLLFDGQSLQSPYSKGRGIGRYAYSLLASLRLVRPEWRISVVELAHLPRADRERLPAGLLFERLDLPMLDHRLRINRWFNDRAYGDWLADHPADAFLSAHSFEFDGVHPLYGERRPPTVVVLYDLIPQRFDDVYLADGPFRDFYTARLRQTCDADLLLAISRWTARDFQELQSAGPARVTTIGGAPDPSFQPLEAAQLREVENAVRGKFGLTRDFILNPSGQCWRKNSRGALLAYAQLPEDLRSQCDFVVACKINRAEEDELHRLAAEYGLGHCLRVTGFVSDEELRALYQLCRVCIFPSFYEGIGLPVIEAQQCGAPVVTSDCSSLPEFAGPFAFLGDPGDPAAMVRALTNTLREPRALHEAQRMAFAREFRWDQVAERAARAIEAELSGGERPFRRQRPRLAWVTSAPPGSIAMERAEELIAELQRRFVVEVVIPDDHPGISAASNCQVLLVRAGELRDRHRVCPFNYFLYDCTSSAALPFLAGLARTYPGLLLDGVEDEPAQRPAWWARWLGPADDGFLARAVISPARWAALRPQVDGPLYLIESPKHNESIAPVSTPADALAAALESLGRERPQGRARAA
jgi:glycosyltransferase involved in cell wall biosynthesis